MTAETTHTCSYECERPGCIRAQRDELVAKVEALRAEVAEWKRVAAAQETEIKALRAEVERLKSENARIREALQAIVDEVSDGLVPYSSDSYLPAHLVEQARAVLPKENSND